ncbi:hypothetical protein [Rhizobium sp. BK491]|uniref:hypothetical protein n=1 Tax=Rhizobium sp. BK491 TaxID=2587009 RepID=UPI001612DD9E|nr:hypothetical protein [Rhizobium sp. BK491]MBB3572027.1 hypothetical protein [Rhizobium sp. BK491]
MSGNQTNSEALSPHEYFRRANDFYCACRVLPDFNRAFMPMWPQHTLFGHAIELVLKAFLLSRGVDVKELKNGYGHQLEKLHALAVELALPRDDRIVRMIGFLDEPHRTARARYPNPRDHEKPIATVEQFYGDYERLISAITQAMSGSGA